MTALNFLLLAVLLSILHPSDGVLKSIVPVLKFTHTDGQVMAPPLHQADMSIVNQTLKNFIKNSTEACTVGLFAFYPDKYYLSAADPSQTFVLGSVAVGESCHTLTPNDSAVLDAMMSYRHLGPEDDISVKSITLYPEPYFGGGPPEIIPQISATPIIPSTNPVKSYVITAPTDDNAAANIDYDHVNMIKLYRNADATGPSTCLALILTDNNVNVTEKIYGQANLGQTEFFGSLKFSDYSDTIFDVGGECYNANWLAVPPRFPR